MVNVSIRRFFQFLACLLLISTYSFSYAKTSTSLLSKETLNRAQKVPEFAYILEVAKDLEVNVYLFGGTAAAFAHYVRWDLEREAGDSKYQAERFDYDYTNIYRGNQDLDIVVDASPQIIKQFQKRLQDQYPHFVGSKTAWEVRSLKDNIGDKLALLNNPDFLNQHTDSNSIGLIHLNSSNSETTYKSLHDWDNPKSTFLTDIAEGRVRFLYNDKHEETRRFRSGQNPPILSVIRYIAKVAQYEVKASDSDLSLIQQIVSATKWTELTSYATEKLEQFALKALLNAPNSEFAWNLLEKTGLRTKLIELDGNQIQKQDSLSWWMNKEPLRSKLFGSKGRTGAQIAKELGLTEVIVSHETNSFVAYDNITRSARGETNAFISRSGVSGETAVMGNGFYVKIGQSGARGTNLTIRFKLHHEAREGEDFKVRGNYIVVTNKRALVLIQENLDLSIKDFLKLLISGDIKTNDKGLVEKFKRKFGRVDTSSDEFKEAQNFLLDSVHIADDLPKKLQFSAQDTDLSTFEGLMTFIVDGQRQEYFSRLIDEDKEGQWLTKSNWISQWIDINPGSKSIAFLAKVLSRPRWRNHENLAFMIFEKVGFDRSKFESGDFSGEDNSYFKTSFNLLGLALNHKALWDSEGFLAWVFTTKILINSSDRNERIHQIASLAYSDRIKLEDNEIAFVQKINWLEKLHLLIEPLKKGILPLAFYPQVLTKVNPDEHPEIVSALKKGFRTQRITMAYYAHYLLNHPNWSNREDIISSIMEGLEKNKSRIMDINYYHTKIEGLTALRLLQNPLVKKNTDWHLLAIEAAVKDQLDGNYKSYHSFSDFDLNPSNQKHIDFLNRLIQELEKKGRKSSNFINAAVRSIGTYLLKHPEMTAKLDQVSLENSHYDFLKLAYIHQPHIRDDESQYPYFDELMNEDSFYKVGQGNNTFLKYLIRHPYFLKHHLNKSNKLTPISRNFYYTHDEYIKNSAFHHLGPWHKQRALITASNRDFLLALLKQNYISYALMKYGLTQEKYLNDQEVLQEGLHMMIFAGYQNSVSKVIFTEYVQSALMKSSVFSITELEIILKYHLGIKVSRNATKWSGSGYIKDQRKARALISSEIIDTILEHPNIRNNKQLQEISGSEQLNRKELLDYIEMNQSLSTQQVFMCHEIL